MNAVDIRLFLCDSLPRLAVLALRMTGDKYDAEDLVQRTCVRALEQSRSLPSAPAPFTWLYSVLYSIWTNEVSAKEIRARHVPYLTDQFFERMMDACRTPECIASDIQVLKIMDLLPETQRSVVISIVLEGFTYSETAELLGIPIGTVMSRFSRARIAMAAALSKKSSHIS